ncbi:MAG: TatD family hydrolase [Chloroflexi bacterium]|nr:TatD family hydrolase [Chloroflexota bacterium]
MILFDSHTHLESPRYNADREEVICRAVSAGVTRMISCGSDLATSRQNVALATKYKSVYAAVGVHGHEASSAFALAETEVANGGQVPIDQVVEEVIVEIAALAQELKVVAIGEIGLDYHYQFSPRPAQRAVLARQLALACALELPVILHNRESDEDLRRLVDAVPGPLRGVLHCFMADERMAIWALDRGLYIGIAGPITFRNVAHLPDVVRRIPLDRLLIETDSPWLAPHPQRGRRNEPAYVRHIAERLAEILNLSPEVVAARTTENACRLFGVA